MATGHVAKLAPTCRHAKWRERVIAGRPGVTALAPRHIEALEIRRACPLGGQKSIQAAAPRPLALSGRQCFGAGVL
jgi:hypothetical protein